MIKLYIVEIRSKFQKFVLTMEEQIEFDFYLLDRGSVVANGEITQLSDEIITKYM